MLNKIFHITLKEKDTAIYSFPCPSVKRKYIVYITYIHTHSTQCVQLTQVLLDMLLSWKKNGRQHKANITSPKQSRYAVKKDRVLKCSVVAHLVVLLIPSYTREDLEQSKDRNEDNSTGIFHPDFYDRGQRSHTFTSFCEIPRGETLGCHRQQRKNKSQGFRQRPGEHTSHSPCIPACPYCQVQTMGKSRVCVGHRLCRKLSPALKTVAFIYCFEKGGLLLPNQVQPPC